MYIRAVVRRFRGDDEGRMFGGAQAPAFGFRLQGVG